VVLDPTRIFFSVSIHSPFPDIIPNYKFASTAAPPNSAPTAIAPVFIGAALPLVFVPAADAADEAELILDAAELVIEAIALVMESLSEPVAVESLFEYDTRALLASALMELALEVNSDAAEDAPAVALETMEDASAVALETMELTSMGLVRVAV